MAKKKNRRTVTKLSRGGNKEYLALNKINKLLSSADNPTPIIEPVKPIIQKNEVRYLPIERAKVSLDNITLTETDHGYKRAVERLLIQNPTQESVNKRVRDCLHRSHYLGRVRAEDGTYSEMFILDDLSFHLTTDFKFIKTVLKFHKIRHNPAQSKIKEVVHREFRKLDRKEKSSLKKLELHRLEVSNEISSLQLRMFKTKSKSVKLACSGRIKALEQYIEECEQEINNIQNEKRQIAYTYVTVC